MKEQQLSTAHYDKFVVKLTKEEIASGEIRLDPYRVALEWSLGTKDPSGALFHILKTIARYGDKNATSREIQAILATAKRLQDLTKEPVVQEITTSIFTEQDLKHMIDRVVIKSTLGERDKTLVLPSQRRL